MGYQKMLIYGNTVEIYQYEKEYEHIAKRRTKVQDKSLMPNMVTDGTNPIQQTEQTTKRKDSARRAAMGFRRLVAANLGKSDNPLLVTLTYAENQTDIEQGHKDFKSFARNLKNHFDKKIRYIAIPEFQERGAIHFHALIWGLPTQELAQTERRTRLFAGFWQQGITDVVATDGSKKLAGYLAKYMSKAFLDPRLSKKKPMLPLVISDGLPFLKINY